MNKVTQVLTIYSTGKARDVSLPSAIALTIAAISLGKVTTKVIGRGLGEAARFLK